MKRAREIQLRRRHRGGFSLLEMLIVLTIVVGLLVMTTTGVQGFNRNRSAVMAEVAGVLSRARSIALARGEDVYVAFVTENARDPEHRFRRYALFMPATSEQDGGERNLFTRDVEAISAWFALPEGLLFALGEEFEVEPNVDFRTIIDAGASYQREFPFRLESDSGAVDGAVTMPFLMFNARGELDVPPVYGEIFHHVGVVEAAYEEGTDNDMNVPDRLYLGWQIGVLSGKNYPRSECVGINAYTGRIVPLTH